nr:bromodomain-containing protein 7-like [Onthophagus taurus]XP_022907565.1 bromodomain-containing protein 7-like [Onthophagus taurus]
MDFSHNIKKHKKHKSEKREKDSYGDKPQGLKLILKVGSQGTPEHNTEWGYQGPGYEDQVRSHHKKSKKKKKKKDKNKDREKKHKHHHKEKKRKRDEIFDDCLDDKDDKDEVCSELGSPSQREPRTCVLRQRQERSPLQRMLDHLLKAIEKRDPNQFFAWPVTDNIAPGYSTIISRPMDLSTMKQKIDDNLYVDMQDFIADFKLMCTNAMEYNHIDTVYYKASKKLLHAGLKLFQPEKMGWVIQLIPELTSKDFGFEIPPELRAGIHQHSQDGDGFGEHISIRKRKMPQTKFEAVPDDLEPEEILARAQQAAREARAKLALKGGGPGMGFLRQREDGTTNLNILVGGDGVIPGTKKRPVLLGALTGKLTEGTGQIQGFREDRRNVAKPVKPLYYGAFGSYAPSYDSAFANLTKDESDLIYQTYGSDTAVQYAESLVDFTKDSNYATYLADSLLDLFTGNEHTKTKKVLDDHKKLREEEEAVKVVLETKPQQNVSIKLEDLRSLANDGIDVEFLDDMAADIKTLETQQELQVKLDTMSQLLDKLHKVQYQRLSLPLPAHLSQIPAVSEEEINLAENITDNLTDIAKKVNPGDIASIPGVRKALGVAVENETDVSELELELRQYLECESNLCPSPLKNDNTLEDILME